MELSLWKPYSREGFEHSHAHLGPRTLSGPFPPPQPHPTSSGFAPKPMFSQVWCHIRQKETFIWLWLWSLSCHSLINEYIKEYFPTCHLVIWRTIIFRKMVNLFSAKYVMAIKYLFTTWMKERGKEGRQRMKRKDGRKERRRKEGRRYWCLQPFCFFQLSFSIQAPTPPPWDTTSGSLVGWVTPTPQLSSSWARVPKSSLQLFQQIFKHPTPKCSRAQLNAQTLTSLQLYEHPDLEPQFECKQQQDKKGGWGTSNRKTQRRSSGKVTVLILQLWWASWR